MSVVIHSTIQRLSQSEFGSLAFKVMSVVFDIHNEFGRLFDERIYKRELANRLPGVRLETPLDVQWCGFTKRYYLDALIEEGGLFEFKAIDTLAPRDRAQTLNYLLLAGLAHAKLINTRPDQVEHEFVNTSLRLADRTRFIDETVDWDESLPGALLFRELVVGMLREWGTGLDLGLYEDALTFFLGGDQRVIQLVPVVSGDRLVAHQRMHMAASRIAFRITSITHDIAPFGDHLHRFVRTSNLSAMLWANITLNRVSFISLKR